MCCRFSCLIYATVVPGLDVAAVQSQMHFYLKAQYHPAGLLLLVANDSIRTTAVGQFSHPAPTRVNLAEVKKKNKQTEAPLI